MKLEIFWLILVTEEIAVTFEQSLFVLCLFEGHLVETEINFLGEVGKRVCIP